MIGRRRNIFLSQGKETHTKRVSATPGFKIKTRC
jgi:hypothetical protein